MNAPHSVVDWLAKLVLHTAEDQTTGCWIWTGPRKGNGYGQFAAYGPIRQAHRAAYTLLVGPVPQGMMVRHDCDQPLCANPRHLRLGTQKDNIGDAVARGRHPHGSSHGMAKLSDALVRELRAASGSISSIARRFGVTRVTVRRIREGKLWKHVN